MKKFENKTTEITNGEAKMTYAELALLCIKNINVQKGVTLEEMRQGIKVMDILESKPEVIELEDTDHSFLLQKIDAMQWAMYHKDIVAFCDAIKEAK